MKNASLRWLALLAVSGTLFAVGASAETADVVQQDVETLEGPVGDTDDAAGFENEPAPGQPSLSNEVWSFDAWADSEESAPSSSRDYRLLEDEYGYYDSQFDWDVDDEDWDAWYEEDTRYWDKRR